MANIPHTVVQQEYDTETMEGFVQLRFKDRFLVEIQLEKLLPESFQTIVNFQVPLEALIKAAGPPDS